MAGDTTHLYFHSPCFDGLISAVLMSDHLRTIGRGRPELHPVNYDLNDTWVGLRLAQPAAIVDFMYHPDASIWFDHHATAFLTQDFERHYRARREPLVMFDRQSPSCAMLIWRQRLRMTGDHEGKVLAADLIDSARYESPQQAVFGDAPAFRLNASMAVGETAEYTSALVEKLQTLSLEQAAALPEVTSRYDEFLRLRDLGMRAFTPVDDLRRHDGYVLTDDGIVLFAVDGTEGLISRYAPFTAAPHAAYSLGATRNGDQTKITAMRNPWRHFESVPLGEIFSRFGGGGHQRVASTRLHGKSREEVLKVLFEIKAAIECAIANQIRGAPA